MASISIIATLKDQFSPGVNSMRNSLKAFDKDAETTAQKIQNLSKKQDALRDAQAKTQVKLDGLTASLREARSSCTDFDDAIQKTKLEGLHKQIIDAKQEIQQFGKEARTAQKEINALSDTSSKVKNRVGDENDSLIGKLGAAGIGKLAGDAFSNFLGSQLSSMMGVPEGEQIAALSSNTFNGAIMGAMAAGPVGAAWGGIAGLASGAVNAYTIQSNAKDDSFRNVVQSQYDTVTTERQNGLAAGTALAASRETDLISFSTLFGDEEVAKSYLSDMRSMSNTTPFLYDDLAGMSKTLKTYGYSVDELLPQLTRVGDAGAALGLAAQDMNEVATAIGRMKSSDKTTLEYINPLVGRGIPALDYLAEAMNMDKGQVYEGISKGQISGTMAAEIISDYMGTTFDGAMERQSKMFDGLQSTLQGFQQDAQAAMGAGFLDQRTPFMANQVLWSEENAERLERDNHLIGQYQASLENLKDQMQMDARDALSTGIVSDNFTTEGTRERLLEMHAAYQELEEQRASLERSIGSTSSEKKRQELTEEYNALGAELGNLLAEAKVLASNEYTASEGWQAEIESQRTLADRIQKDTVLNDLYYETGMVMGRQFSMGVISAIDMEAPFQRGGAMPEPTKRPTMEGPSHKYYRSGMDVYDYSGEPGAAYGIAYVPQDNYPVRLHEGERVLTAAEARTYEQGTAAPITISGNNFTVREEADVYKIAQELVQQVILAQVVS